MERLKLIEKICHAKKQKREVAVRSIVGGERCVWDLGRKAFRPPG